MASTEAELAELAELAEAPRSTERHRASDTEAQRASAGGLAGASAVAERGRPLLAPRSSLLAVMSAQQPRIRGPYGPEPIAPGDVGDVEGGRDSKSRPGRTNDERW